MIAQKRMTNGYYDLKDKDGSKYNPKNNFYVDLNDDGKKEYFKLKIYFDRIQKSIK